jgi:hypothetical protein
MIEAFILLATPTAYSKALSDGSEKSNGTRIVFIKIIYHKNISNYFQFFYFKSWRSMIFIII